MKNSKAIAPIPEFKAIYNPFTRNLLVRYGDDDKNNLVEHEFEDSEEWTKVSFNGNEKHPCYLHIQLDYDETAQLLFYPRVDGSEELNEDLGTYYNSGHKIPDNLRIVLNDFEWNVQMTDFLNVSAESYSTWGKNTYHDYADCVEAIERISKE